MKKYSFMAALVLFTGACFWAFKQPEWLTDRYPQDKNYLNFPTPLSPTTNYDVDIALLKTLMAAKQIDEAQRLFDILSWQQFIALNWPLGANGKPLPNVGVPGKRSWENWEESFEVFRQDGSAPTPAIDYPQRLKGKLNLRDNPRILFRTNKAAELHARDTADEFDQAFTSPIWDQNGNMVRYEVRLNKKTVDYLVQNELYNLDGQIAFSKKGGKVSFPAGKRNEEGTIELKLAWKVLTPNDIPERYLVTDAVLINRDGTFSPHRVGLVGMHIASKTESSPQWIWATFEHVDNLETNPLQKVNGKSIKPSFYDPGCGTCPVNLIPDTSKAFIKNQIQRVLPIPMATQQLNQQVQKLLADKKSPLQYYQLIGTQWPTDPSAAPYKLKTPGSNTLPEAVTNKSGGRPVPTYLTNMIMETYFQGGTDGPTDTTQAHYNRYLGNEPAYYQIQGFPQADSSIIFGTESCIGCHFSGSIATSYAVDPKTGKSPTFGAAGSSDFEWLLNRKAQFKAKK